MRGGSSPAGLPRTLALALSISAAAPGAAGGESAPFAPPPSLVELAPPAAPGAMAPSWAEAGGTLLLSWLEPQGSGHRLQVARIGADGFGPATTVTAGDGFFANWADFPAVAAAGDGALYAHWLAKTAPDTYAYAVQVARSTDGGSTWRGLGALHDDRSPTEHGFVSWAAEASGVRAFWLDGRTTAQGGAMSLRSARVGERVGASEEIDARVCDCCQTGAAATPAGPVVVYRDRSPEEVRDIAAVRRTASGWSEPLAVAADGWKIPGCPVNGPAVAADGEVLAVAWFTAARPPGPRVLAAFSADSGASFGTPVLVDGERPLGRVAVAALDGAQAAVAWLAVAGSEAELRLARVGPRGRAGEGLALARTSAARASGFPRLARLGDRIFVAWVEAGGEGVPTRLRAASLPLSALR